MKKTRFTIQVNISPEQEDMKQFLKQRGFNLSKLVRNYLTDLYDREKIKEVA